ncbi:carboxylesterase/lipase family protein [Pseudoroseomonas cervicalis]|uniref:carboxylesterase/lipase family protein n=1 Tax=Teichococcus cervicalis TaxID=204525 RepID=UPI0022F14F18|nr:carboxylesterase family protein [Pseudoroseomonas cervicalis]WBV44445.1 carboxylesterase family protein [Pseudoroseomonas cervicalis]
MRLPALLLAALLLGACDGDPGGVRHLVGAPGARPLAIDTEGGPVQGVAAPEGQAFLNIPFAAPPSGARRWLPPEAPEPWSAPRDATRLGPGCLQNFSPAYLRGQTATWMQAGEEDCLHLNVYAPASARPGERRPVMVWLYGGGLVVGSNRQYDLSRLAERQGVILVAPNYRLGALGFLAHPALRAAAGGAANLGLLDQQAALRWVQRNIARFGGDPGNVTLFGESAGAWSTCLQLVAPAAEGLFHRAILQSGACQTAFSTLPLAEAEAAGLAYAAALGCGASEPPHRQAECLRAQTARAVTGQPAAARGMMGQTSWGAVAGDTVLPLPPAEAIAQGRVHRVPVLLGYNADEGRLFGALYRLTGALFSEDSHRHAVTRLFGPLAPQALAAYPPGLEADVALSFSRLVTDAVFACPTLALAEALSPLLPVRAYLFDDPAAPSRLPALPLLPPLGAYHAAEIAYVLGTAWALADPAAMQPAQRDLSAAMQAAWGRFAARGDPDGPAGSVGALPAWPAWRPGAGRVMRLRPGGSGLVPPPLGAHRCERWAPLGF